ncbi:hypothetical protein GYMLUDRAFT_76329 [Collybiopsis luxurians FD-317 M1]|uniref:Uncharacterized protein n=1 Tax=Collybiopsis luxurians FD-317 M1 TaxID=944289 RepID=A0A0D0C0U6_9AGAR|nr:hypothetical protein GYMLUDRAFT_76329 [Collybiopsis luxurians FD-317 M1]
MSEVKHYSCFFTWPVHPPICVVVAVPSFAIASAVVDVVFLPRVPVFGLPLDSLTSTSVAVTVPDLYHLIFYPMVPHPLCYPSSTIFVDKCGKDLIRSWDPTADDKTQLLYRIPISGKLDFSRFIDDYGLRKPLSGLR